jgi:putative transposase
LLSEETFAKQLGLKPVRTPVESPQSNGMANRPDSQTVMRELKLWFEHYNEKHPHSALG